MNSAKIIYLERKKIIDELKRIALNIKKEGKDNLKDVILFGSLSREDFTGLSDVDIVIILKKSKDNPLDRIRRFRKYFFIDIDVDLFVYTEDEFLDMLKKGNDFARIVKEEGISLLNE